MTIISLLLSLALAQEAGGPDAAAKDFLNAYMQSKQTAVIEEAQSLHRFMSKRLNKILDDAAACQKDWSRQQPPGEVNKPPFVDCCLFASSPDGKPTSYNLGSISLLADGRYRAVVNFEYKDKLGAYLDKKHPLQTFRWQDALLIVKTSEGYKIDDFIYLRDSKANPPLRLSGIVALHGCQGPHWIGPK
jgi:hypothetical protein